MISRCYKVLDDETRTWHDARLKCKFLGADLAVIHSSFENKFIGKLLPKKTNAWIGYSRKTDGKFHWVDGSTTMYTRWGYNQPKDGMCTEMQRTWFLWNDLSCTKNHRAAICEKGITHSQSGIKSNIRNIDLK